MDTNQNKGNTMSNIVMEVSVVEQAGFEAALKGLSFNKKQEKEMWDVAEKLASHDGGHNKFLESMIVWLEVNAPRYWWQEADTYRLSTKQSESTMHTLVKEVESGINIDAFEDDSITTQQLQLMNDALKSSDPMIKLTTLKKALPEGFLQKRMWCMSYKTLRNIIVQRGHHRLPHWRMFIHQILEQIDHPEFLPRI